MRRVGFAALLLAAASVATPVQAQGIRPDRYQACSADADSKALQGAARKAFLIQCMGVNNHIGTLMPASQQQRLRVCNLQAADLKVSAETRNAFMLNCMGRR